jgi:hypothetical protein
MEISILKALNELTLIEKRILKATKENNTFLHFSVGGVPPVGFKTINDVEEKIKSNYDSIVSLIRRRIEIKTAITQSNAETSVNILGQDVTVASAIEMKKSINYELELLRALTSSSATIYNKVEQHNTSVEVEIDKLVTATYSGKNSKVSKDEYDSIASPMKIRKTAIIIDPLDIKSKIESHQNRIDEFVRNINNILTESNATTKITISDS